MVKLCYNYKTDTGATIMYKYQLWIRINQYQTVNTIIFANSDYEAKLLGEAQYGAGNVLNYSQISE